MLWLVSFAFSKEEDGKSEKIMFTCISHAVRYFPSFCMQLLFHMFSTLMLLEILLCMAIMQNNPLPYLYTQYYCTV